MSRTRVGVAAVAVLVAVTGTCLLSQSGSAQTGKADAKAPSGRAADEKAIEAASAAFAKAFEAGDVKFVAGMFTENAEYIDDDGDPIRGREELAKAYGKFFEKRTGVKAESKSEAVRFLGTDAAIEEGKFTVTPKSGPSTVSRFSTLYVREGGKWKIALLKEWSEQQSPPTLKDLEWLVGTWESDSEGMKATTTYEWTVNKSFLKAQYTLKPKKEGDPTISGVQVIGVDPAVGHIRAWLFDEHGGIGESNWHWVNGEWQIESIGTLPDGTRTTALNIMVRSGDDAFLWKSVQRTVDGESQPDVGPVKVKRVTATK
ncbi:MAG: SgcJ/EcaC family oxidoreductase [Planctomycetaceae bacterium]|nr:SgcJ/EcaC family oxidoreductase [Planctomycetaceae bacterium]